MSEENMNISQAALKTKRANANNTNNLRAAAEIADKTDNIYAKAIGGGIKAADKLTNGKASEKLGNALTLMNKMDGLKGRMRQAALNKLSESGTTDRINKAVNAKNNNVPNTIASNPNATKNQGVKSVSTDLQQKTEEETTDGGMGSTTISMKLVKTLIAIAPAAALVIVFCCVIISASQVFVNAISLGTADSLSSSEVEKKINKKGTKDLDEEKTDNDVAYDIYIDDSKFKKNIDIIQVANSKYIKRKYNEADLDELEDFFPIEQTEDGEYDKNLVYDFYFKMYNLFITYRDTYDVHLDLPLLMATLNLQSSDRNEIFKANLSPEDRKNTARVLPIEEFDYYFTWETLDYTSTKKTSNHDMELLAQNMISKQVKEKCVDSSNKVVNENILKDNEIGTQTLVCSEGETYETEDLGYLLDNKKYKEFLKEFLEKKYYTKEGYKAVATNTKPADDTTPNTYKDGNYVADVSFNDSSFGQVYYFNQNDYNDYYYSSDPSKAEYKRSKGGWATIASHGCGPTSLSIVLSSILNRTIDPIETTTEVCKNGGCTSSGSYHNVLMDVGQKYGVKVTQTGKNQEVINALSSNNSLVIVLMGPGTFTSGGHYIVLTGANSSGQVSVADPASRKRTDQKWFSFNTIVEQRQTYANYMIFSR